ncbi:MAG: hypothetical protein PHW31_03875 [Candidatus Pacebacteria bacterium]|nr:hypothetical protein [Candidatus Paceibacterota bacterium]
MNFLKLIGYGILIWVVAFVIVSIFIGFKVSSDNMWVKIITTLAVFIAAILLAKNLKESSQSKMFLYGILWAVIALILDAVITARFTDWEVFGQWNITLGYLLIILASLLAIKKGK